MVVLIAVFIAWQIYLMHLIFQVSQGIPASFLSITVDDKPVGKGSPHYMDVKGPEMRQDEGGVADCGASDHYGHDQTYLVQRMQMLDQQVKLLHAHLQGVTSELKVVMDSLNTHS
jgi:hypothetical protein